MAVQAIHPPILTKVNHECNRVRYPEFPHLIIRSPLDTTHKIFYTLKINLHKIFYTLHPSRERTGGCETSASNRDTRVFGCEMSASGCETRSSGCETSASNRGTRGSGCDTRVSSCETSGSSCGARTSDRNTRRINCPWGRRPRKDKCQGRE